MAFGFISDDMKHLMTLAALFVSSLAMAQIPTFPWNPDENGDQFIGLPDLLGLLTVYGQEFENAIVSEDGESAIMYMGDMAYPLCAQACENLPGIWQLPEIEDLGLVWAEANTTSNYQTWLTKGSSEGVGAGDGVWKLRLYQGNGYIYGTAEANAGLRCYCTAKQLPRVEYGWCVENNANAFNDCVDSYLSDGYLPLQGLSIGTDDSGSEKKTQAFWRFAH
jgi:hypothetical protein